MFLSNWIFQFKIRSELYISWSGLLNFLSFETVTLFFFVFQDINILEENKPVNFVEQSSIKVSRLVPPGKRNDVPSSMKHTHQEEHVYSIVLLTLITWLR